MDQLSIADLGTILSIWAHPDDETYLAGGIMAQAVAAGQRVVCVSATAGEHGTDDAAVWPPERLGQVRRWETAAAMAVLGVTEHHFLGYADGALSEMDAEQPVAGLAVLIEQIAPDTILTFGPDGTTFHPDHQTVSRWADAAWQRAGRPGRLLHSAMSAGYLAKWGQLYEQWGVFMTDERPAGVPAGELAIDLTLSGAELDRKITALAAMSTQTGKAMAALGSAYWDLNAEECFVAVAQH